MIPGKSNEVSVFSSLALKNHCFCFGVAVGVAFGVAKPGFLSRVRVYIGGKKQQKKYCFELFKYI